MKIEKLSLQTILYCADCKKENLPPSLLIIATITTIITVINTAIIIIIILPVFSSWTRTPCTEIVVLPSHSDFSFSFHHICSKGMFFKYFGPCFLVLLVVDQMTLHRYCALVSFRCQHCPHRGMGNSQKPFFLEHTSLCSACRQEKGEPFINIFGATSKEAALTQNPRMKKFHESAIQPHQTPIYPTLQQGQSTVPRLCGVNRVLLTAGLGSIVGLRTEEEDFVWRKRRRGRRNVFHI